MNVALSVGKIAGRINPTNCIDTAVKTYVSQASHNSTLASNKLFQSKPMTDDIWKTMSQTMHNKSTSKPRDNIVLLPVPESRYEDVLNHVTPIFLRDEPLSQCFAPCTTGKRERDFRAYATTQLKSGLCMMAVEGTEETVGLEQLTKSGKIVGSCLNRPLTRQQVMEDKASQESEGEEDPLLLNVLLLLTSVHRKLDLFTALGVDRLLEVGLASVEPTHVGKGLATRLINASLELGASAGFTAAKGDATGGGSAKACRRCGMTVIYTLPYNDYTIDGKVVFRNITGNPNASPALIVLAAKLQKKQPHVLPLHFKLSNL